MSTTIHRSLDDIRTEAAEVDAKHKEVGSLYQEQLEITCKADRAWFVLEDMDSPMRFEAKRVFDAETAKLNVLREQATEHLDRWLELREEYQLARKDRL